MKEMIKKLQKRSNKKGFTLVEIIVVLVILTILAAIAVPAVLGYVQDAKDSKYISEARAIYIVVQTEEAKFRAENNLENADLTEATNAGTLYSETISDQGVGTESVTKGVASEKTGLTNVEVKTDGKDRKKYKYIIKWTSTDGKNKQASLTSNKDVSISDQK